MNATAKAEPEVTVPSGPGVNPAVLEDLAAQTPPEEIKQRVAYGRGGPQHNPDGTPKMLDYVDARFVQERLDTTLGPANWQSAYQDVGGSLNSVRCGIGILVAGIGWVWKWDVGVASNIEPEKGAHSDAFKRAAVQWGVARDLYSNREDRVDDATSVAAAPAEPATVRQQVDGGGRQARYAGPQAAPAPAPVAEQVPVLSQDQLETLALEQGLVWDCPVHGQHKIVPPGRGKKPPYRPYGAFFACPAPYCPEKGPRVVTG